jgi:hypothetical protein
MFYPYQDGILRMVRKREIFSGNRFQDVSENSGEMPVGKGLKR